MPENESEHLSQMVARLERAVSKLTESLAARAERIAELERLLEES